MGFSLPASKFADIQVFSLQLSFSVIYCIIHSSTCLSSSTTVTLQVWTTVQFPIKYYLRIRGVTCHRMAQVVCLQLTVRSDQGSIRGSKMWMLSLGGSVWLLGLFRRFPPPPPFLSVPSFLHVSPYPFCTLSTSVTFQSPWGIINSGSSPMAVDVIDLLLHF